MDFFEMPVEDSRRFCELTRARGPVRLAAWLRADGIDPRQFDGSLGSLVPLWQWAVGFIDCDCPGVPPHARPPDFRPGPWERQGQDLAPGWRALYVGEALVASWPWSPPGRTPRVVGRCSRRTRTTPTATRRSGGTARGP